MEFLIDLEFWGWVSLIVGAIVLWEIIAHFLFYWHLRINEMSKRISILVSAIFVIVASIASYNMSLVVTHGEDYGRLALKLFQIVSLLYLWYSLHQLRKFHKRISES